MDTLTAHFDPLIQSTSRRQPRLSSTLSASRFLQPWDQPNGTNRISQRCAQRMRCRIPSQPLAHSSRAARWRRLFTESGTLPAEGRELVWSAAAAVNSVLKKVTPVFPPANGVLNTPATVMRVANGSQMGNVAGPWHLRGGL